MGGRARTPEANVSGGLAKPACAPRPLAQKLPPPATRATRQLSSEAIGEGEAAALGEASAAARGSSSASSSSSIGSGCSASASRGRHRLAAGARRIEMARAAWATK